MIFEFRSQTLELNALKDQVFTKVETSALPLTDSAEKASRSKDKRYVKCYASFPKFKAHQVGLGKLFLCCNIAVTTFLILRSLRTQKKEKRYQEDTELPLSHLQASLSIHS